MSNSRRLIPLGNGYLFHLKGKGQGQSFILEISQNKCQKNQIIFVTTQYYYIKLNLVAYSILVSGGLNMYVCIKMHTYTWTYCTNTKEWNSCKIRMQCVYIYIYIQDLFEYTQTYTQMITFLYTHIHTNIHTYEFFKFLFYKYVIKQ